MKTLIFLLFFSIPTFAAISAQSQETLIYHNIKVDSQGAILPWYNDDLGTSYDHIVKAVWSFWNSMRTDLNGLPYYMNHQVWRPDINDPRGIGGDQIQMAMSSWRLLYAYTGDELVKQNMKFLADYYLSHSLSSPKSKWPNLPYPFNTLIYSGVYDGDMVLGEGYLQPDKAGSFALELLHLYKMSPNDRYLEGAVNIAHTLVRKIKNGDENNSPLPFKVNAQTGVIGNLLDNYGGSQVTGPASYTTNWSSTLEMLIELKQLDPNHANEYQKAIGIFLTWMKNYPLQNNKWGPFFEDVRGWSDTQINAITFARFIMEHPEYFPNWKTEVPKIFDWVYATLGNDSWKSYGVTVVNEQTIYQVPGESHVARQGSTELLYCALSGDNTIKQNAIRQLSWATYMVDSDGKNKFPQDENWLTDGYGDYVRHYLRAMAAVPELAPGDQDHILSSTSVIQQADYHGNVNKFLVPYVHVPDIDKVRVYYSSYDSNGTETVRLANKPGSVLLDGNSISELSALESTGYKWTTLQQGGLLEIRRDGGSEVIVLE